MPNFGIRWRLNGVTKVWFLWPFFLLHSNIADEYDQTSDIARWYKVKAVPCFLFLDGGAVVRWFTSLRSWRMRGSESCLPAYCLSPHHSSKHTASRRYRNYTLYIHELSTSGKRDIHPQTSLEGMDTG